jgi:long-chain acyl-CoA synthetase
VPDHIRNLADAVRRAASTDPDARALIARDAALTWGELDAAVDAVASGLLALDLPASGPAAARVALSLPNVPEFAVAYFAILRAGLVAVPMNPGYTAREIRHQVSDSGACAVIATSDVVRAIAGVRADLPALRYVYQVGGDTGPDGDVRDFGQLRDVGRPGANGPVPSRAGGEDLAVLLYTSGTAGLPKGAMLSHRALIANHRQVSQINPPIVSQGDVVLLALPLFHAFGLNAGLGAVAWHGACGVLAERFDPAESLDLIIQHQVSVIAAVPQMYIAWSSLPDLDERLATVRVAVSGASPLGAAAGRRFLETTRHPVFEGYGLTETSPVLTTALASPVPKVGSIGRPIPDVEIKLVGAGGGQIARIGADGLVEGDHDDFDDDAGGVPGTDPGEIVARGSNLFSGYWPDRSGGPDADGWWPTADVAYADADGDLFIVDRLGELILVSGFNVYPHEVELVLAAHQGVEEAAVVGVEHAYTGQTVKAYVVRAAGSTVTATELAAHCELNLARFKCPTEYEFVAGLPHSATGKVRKGSLGGAA